MIAQQQYTKRIFKDTAKLYEATANLIIDLANKRKEEEKKFSIVLSGGHTPEQLFNVLSSSPFIDEMPWANTFVFWGDERYVPSNDNMNNAFKAKVLLLNRVPIPRANIYSIPVDIPPAEACEMYQEAIEDFFERKDPQFDLILLGLGENGHTASLFPMSPPIYNKKVGIEDFYLGEEGIFRITMTAPLINQAHHVLFMVTGPKKADIVKTVLTGEYYPDKYPAQLIKPKNGTLSWFLDEEAAKEL